MATRGSKRSSDIQQNATAFEYSDAEWREIAAMISQVRSGVSTEAIREHLLTCARRYRLQVFQPRLSKRRQQWQQVVRQCEKLQQVFSICSEQRLADLRADCPHKEITDGVSGLYDRQLSALAELQELAAAHVNFYAPRGAHDFDFWRLGFDMSKPHWKFHFETLEIWCALGGKARFSRHPKGHISGPLVRYFFAVIRPVMGPSAPSPESFPDIIARFKAARMHNEALIGAGTRG